MTVLVGHPLPVVLDGLVGVLGTQHQTVLHSTDPSEFVMLARLHRPLVAVADVDLDPAAPVRPCEELLQVGVPLVMVTRRGRTRVLDLLAAGAQGVVEADEGLDGVLEAVRVVLTGSVHVPGHLLGRVLHELIVERRKNNGKVSNAGPSELLSRLSPRETEVLRLLAAGGDHREIAEALTISPSTAKTHISRVLSKLDVRSRVEAVALALAHGIAHPKDGEPSWTFKSS